MSDEFEKIAEAQADWWKYDQLQSGEPYDWGGAARTDSEWDNLDFHLDLGCGKLPKGRIGIDRFYSPEVDLMIDLEHLLPAAGVHPEEAAAVMDRTLERYNATMEERYGDDAEAAMAQHGLMASAFLPFPDDSIESIISHHFFEHLRGERVIALMDECYRVLKPGGLLRIIVPLFPSNSAVGDLDHKSYFTPSSFKAFCGSPSGESWLESFSVPYTSARFEEVGLDYTAPVPYELQFTEQDAREVRIALRKWGS